MIKLGEQETAKKVLVRTKRLRYSEQNSLVFTYRDLIREERERELKELNRKEMENGVQ